MSNIKYGLISDTDAMVLEKTIDLICEDFYGEDINITEIGLYSGLTSKYLYEYVVSKEWATSGSVDYDSDSFNFICNYTGIDNNKDGEPLLHFPKEGKLILGNSTEVYNQLEDDSQHLLFIDGDHSLIGVISDFYAYADKVKVGGFLAFHDTGKHIKPFKDFQHGDKNNPDAYISVRKSLHKLDLLGNWMSFNDRENMWAEPQNKQFELIFDEADETNEAGGLTVFKRLY